MPELHHKPRVMQLVLTLSPGGTERLVLELCRRLANDVETLVCCLDEPGEWAAELTKLNIPVVSLKRRPGFHPSLSVRLSKILKEHRIEVVHCHHYSPYVYGVLAAVLHPSVRLVFTEHGRLHGAGISRKRRLVNPVLARWPARICAVSAALKRDMVAEGFPEGAIDVVYNGIDLGSRPRPEDRNAMRTALRVPHDALVLGTVARLDPVKNLGLLLDAGVMLASRFATTQIVIAGDGPDRQALVERAHALGIGERTRFVGYRDDVRALMTAFDIYVNCSLYEGVSLTILEAMATALPVAATDVGGNPEVVVDRETGVLVQPNADALTSGIVTLAASPTRRRAFGDAGRWRVKRHFSIERLVDDYASAYGLSAESLSRRHRKSAPEAVP